MSESGFGDARSQYNRRMQDYRASEFSHVGGATYLDHTGTTLYARSHLEAYYKDLSSNLYGNPHSHNPSSSSSSSSIDRVRETILRHFNTTLAQYSVVFTSGCTGALKLLSDSFPFSRAPGSDPSAHTSYVWYQGSGRPEEGKVPWSPGQSIFCYLDDNHTSVVGVREVAANRGAALVCMTKSGVKRSPSAFQERDGSKSEESEPAHEQIGQTSGNPPDEDEKSSSQANGDSAEGDGDNGERARNVFHLFAYPAQSNFSGYKYPLSWVKDIPAGSADLDGLEGAGGNWLTLLDAAAFVPTNSLDLTAFPAHFVTLSFYKMFGFPTGLGALIVRKDVEEKLHKVYFGGGTVKALISREYYHATKTLLHERMEDGTLSFLDILALEHGFNTFYRLVGSLEDARAHTCALGRHVYRFLKSCSHSNGKPVCIIYSDSDYEDPQTQGGIVSINFLRPTGEFVGYAEVDKQASARGIHVRTGCFCNSSACMRFVGLTGQTILDNLKSGHVCGDDMDMVNGAPIGCVRVSFGYMSTFDDAQKFIDFVKECMVDNSCPAGKDQNSAQASSLVEERQSHPVTWQAIIEENKVLEMEVQGLKKQITDLTLNVKKLSDKQKEESSLQYQLSGVLYKKGRKWPKSNVWKSRFFTVENCGSWIAYYKHRNDLIPAGYIEMDKVISVSNEGSSEQDSDRAFQIVCEGQTHQLKALHEADRRRWVNTIQSILETRRNGRSFQDESHILY